MPNPWDMTKTPLIKTLPIKVFIIDIHNQDDILHSIDLDLGNREHRMYLGKITAWALLQHYSVETMQVVDAEGGKKV